MYAQSPTRPLEPGIDGQEPERRFVISLLLLLQLALFYSFQAGSQALVIVACLTVAPWLPFKNRSISTRTHTALLVLSGFCFFFVGTIRLLNGYSILSLFELFAQYLLLVQAFELLRPRREIDANYAPGLAALTIALLLVSLDFRVAAVRLGWIYVLFTLALFILLRTDLPFMFQGTRLERKKGVRLLSLAVFSLIFGSLAKNEIEQALPQVQQIVSGYWNPQQQGGLVSNINSSFVHDVGLNRIAQYKREHGGELVFSVHANNPPGYMRTLSFDTFDGREWESALLLATEGLSAIGVAASPKVPDYPFPEPLYKLEQPQQFALNSTSPDRHAECMTIDIQGRSGSLNPLPLNASVVVGKAGRSTRIILDRHFSIMPGELQGNQYGVVTGPQFEPSNRPNYLNSLLTLPKSDDEFLQATGDRICKGKNSSREKISAVRDFFLSNFRYSLDSEPARNLNGSTPLEAFVRERRDAHCEYFATATALLLRTQGIPTRLSTGYLVYEMNESLDFFMATSDKAHAWVEAYNSEMQEWILVESTPGIQSYIDKYTREEYRKGLADQREQQQDLWSSATTFWRTLLATFFTRETYRLLWVVPFLLPVAFLWRSWLRRRRRMRRNEQQFCSQHVLRADALAKSLGFTRSPHETCNEFANRLEAEAGSRLQLLVDWYRQFATLRYGTTLNVNEIARLPRRKELLPASNQAST